LLTAPLGNLEKYVKFLVRNKCNAISATPSMWRKLLLLTDLKNLKLKFISLGGEIADSNILKTLSNNFPQARITHIYASTEVGVAFSVKDGKAGFPASYLNKVPNKNIKLKVKQGKLFFKELSESNHISSFDTLTKDNDSFVDTGDIVSVEGDRVYFLGRQNGSINVGGNKVMPNEIESVIRELPEVLDVRAYGKPSPILGTVIVVDVVSNNFGDFAILKELIHGYCRDKLTSFKRPAIIKLVDSIPITSSGKTKR
jgi:acyl-CoA synthetase (AMP-forming)/AMP-acid ligase II